MSTRARLVLVVTALLALAAAVLAGIAARSDSDDEPAAVVEEINAAGVEGPRSPYEGAVRPPAPPGDFALRDQDGKLVSLADLRGTVVVLSPTYATCDETCPVAAQQIRARSTTSRQPNGSASTRLRSAWTRPTTRRTAPSSFC